jgi:hypothetical protein
MVLGPGSGNLGSLSLRRLNDLDHEVKTLVVEFPRSNHRLGSETRSSIRRLLSHSGSKTTALIFRIFNKNLSTGGS